MRQVDALGLGPALLLADPQADLAALQPRLSEPTVQLVSTWCMLPKARRGSAGGGPGAAPLRASPGPCAWCVVRARLNGGVRAGQARPQGEGCGGSTFRHQHPL